MFGLTWLIVDEPIEEDAEAAGELEKGAAED